MNHKKTVKNNTFTSIINKNRNNILSGKQYLLIIPLTKFYCCKENIDKLNNILDGKSPLSLRLIDWFVTNYSKKNLIMYNLKRFKHNLDKNNCKKVSKIDKDNFKKVSKIVKDEDDFKKVSKIEEDSNTINNDNIDIIKNMNNDDDNDSGICSDDEYFTDYFEVFSNYKAQLKSLNKKNFDPFCRRRRIKFYYGLNNNDSIDTTVGQLDFFKWAIENYILEYIEQNITEIENDMNTFTNNKKSKYTDKTKKKKKELKQKIDNKTETKKNDTKKNDTKKNDTKQIASQKPTRRKRKVLSSSINKSFVIHNIKTILDFN